MTQVLLQFFSRHHYVFVLLFVDAPFVGKTLDNFAAAEREKYSGFASEKLHKRSLFSYDL